MNLSQSIIPGQMPRHMSFSPQDSNALIVTGKDCYRFIKKLENDTLKVFYKEITSQKNLVALDLNTDISCHCWLADGRFILCNEKGQIMLMESNGDFK
jgi:hypothetical protein